jgi:hypothetical protein
MINPATTRRETQRQFRPIEDALGASPRSAGRIDGPVRARGAMAALAREQENAAMEAEGILSQADEALVLG